MTLSNYFNIINPSFRKLASILKKYSWIIVGLAILYHLYKYLIIKLIGAQSEHLKHYIALYNLLVHPALIIILMHIVDCYNKNKLPSNFLNLTNDLKRCYLKIFLIYLVLTLLKTSLEGGGIIIVFALTYIKFPFLEQAIFFENLSLWQAIKYNHQLTKRDDILKTLFILIVTFLIIYTLTKRGINSISMLNLSHQQEILYLISIALLSFFLICKLMLTVVYNKIKEKEAVSQPLPDNSVSSTR